MANIIKLNDTMEFRGEVFIVPTLVKGSDTLPITETPIKERLVMDFPDFTENDKAVSVWTFIQNVTDSLQDDGFRAIDDNGVEWNVRLHNAGRYIPVSVFKGKKEGEQVSYTLTAIASRDEKDVLPTRIMKTVKLKLTLTLCQGGFIYRDHGTFEQCLEKLLTN